MKLAGPSSAFAPMPTGHPFGLPGQMSVKDAQTRVVEPSKSSSTNLATHLGLPLRKPATTQDDTSESPTQQVARGPAPGRADSAAASPPPAAAPPTILQLKINEMLQAQAEAQVEQPAPPPEVAAVQKTTAPQKVAPGETASARPEPRDRLASDAGADSPSAASSQETRADFEAAPTDAPEAATATSADTPADTDNRGDKGKTEA